MRFQAQSPQQLKHYINRLKNAHKQQKQKLLPYQAYKREIANAAKQHWGINTASSSFSTMESKSESFLSESSTATYMKRTPTIADPAFTPPANPLKRTQTGRKAIVTLLCGTSGGPNLPYGRFLHAFALTLRQSNYRGEVLVLYTEKFPINVISSSVDQFNLTLQKVSQISIPHSTHRYANMLTKLHLWNLAQYDQIIYYDVDFIFQKNPASAFNDCGSYSLICAVHDQGIAQVRKNADTSNYFNAGFLVLLPDPYIYQQLIGRQTDAYSLQFVEQDLLNNYFSSRWKRLDEKYNLMHCYRQQSIRPDVIAIHEKLAELKKTFPDKRYVWNQL